MRRIAIALCAFLALAFVPALPSKAADSNQDLLNKYLWPPLNPVAIEKINQTPVLGFHFGIVDGSSQSGLDVLNASRITTDSASSPQCDSFIDTSCLKDIKLGNHWWVHATLPPCAEATSIDACIEGVTIIDSKGTRELALTKILYGPKWKADAIHGNIQ